MRNSLNGLSMHRDINFVPHTSSLLERSGKPRLAARVLRALLSFSLSKPRIRSPPCTLGHRMRDRRQHTVRRIFVELVRPCYRKAVLGGWGAGCAGESSGEPLPSGRASWGGENGVVEGGSQKLACVTHRPSNTPPPPARICPSCFRFF